MNPGILHAAGTRSSFRASSGQARASDGFVTSFQRLRWLAGDSVRDSEKFDGSFVVGPTSLLAPKNGTIDTRIAHHEQAGFSDRGNKRDCRTRGLPVTVVRTKRDRSVRHSQSRRLEGAARPDTRPDAARDG